MSQIDVVLFMFGIMARICAYSFYCIVVAVGVNIPEIIISQIFSFFLMLIAQVTPAFFLVVYGFDVSCYIILILYKMPYGLFAYISV